MMIDTVANNAAYLPPPGTQSADWTETAREIRAGQSALSCLPERDLIGLLQRSTVRKLRYREPLFRRGDPGRTVIVVLDGYVKLSSMTASGREVILEIVGPGGCFGELAVLNDWLRHTDATTLTRCRLLAIDGRQFTQVVNRSPEALQAMVQLISQRLRTATERVMDGTALPATARLVKALVQLATLHSPDLRNGARIELALSQTELGGMTGLTRESINKHLVILRDAGLIRQVGGSVTLLDIAALDRLLGDPAC